MIAADLDLEPLVGGERDMRRLGAVGGGDAPAVIGRAQPPEAAIGLADGGDPAGRAVAPFDRAASGEDRLARGPAVDPVVDLAERGQRRAVAFDRGALGAAAGGE